MAKVPADTIKYNIYADIVIDGVVEKPDVVGAIFGQSEGLLGEELELRELQKTGRIGRIEVEIETKAGKSIGKILVPSSLGMIETALIAAAIENVTRVGPCNAKVTVRKIEDARAAKRRAVIERAKELLKKMMEEAVPDTDKITEEVKKAVQMAEITSYKGLPAGPAVKTADTIILVEGRADVLNMLKAGIKNVIAVGGTNIPKQIIELSKERTTIAFVDGDRGGEMILKELMQVADIDYVAKAPKGKEVEELSKKEIILCLRRKVPVSQVAKIFESEEETYNEETEKRDLKKDKEKLLELLKDVKGKLVARLYDSDLELITEIEIKDIIDSLPDIQPYAVVFDGIITQRLVDVASMSNVKYLVGVNVSSITDRKDVHIITDSQNKR
ncbi:MAG TPA: DNA primase [Candidatus Altiarchaeales archaeon]|nr:DNA primase [Candidatus Altiarchaeales archaeon]